MKAIRSRGSIALGAATLIAASCLGSISTAAATPSKSPIVIGMIADETGVAASTFADGPGGAQARIDLQNAEGGVDGHPLKLVVEDDQSTSTGNATASDLLVQDDHAFGIIEDSAFAFGGYKYLQQEGIPVTGGAYDGPEWNTQPNTNLFDADGPTTSAPAGGEYYTYTNVAVLLKDLGVKKMAALSYNASGGTADMDSLMELLAAGVKEGIKNCYFNDSTPFGGANFTSIMLGVHSAGCDGVTCGFVLSSDVACTQAIHNAGLDVVNYLGSPAYAQSVLTSATARDALQGTYISGVINFTTPNAAVDTMLGALKKYDKTYPGGIPDLGLYNSYLEADLMIKGLQLAGNSPSRSAFIKNLREVGDYTAGGILPSPLTFQHFGTAGMLPKELCTPNFQVKGNKFVFYKTTCGALLAVPSIPVS